MHQARGAVDVQPDFDPSGVPVRIGLPDRGAGKQARTAGTEAAYRGKPATIIRAEQIERPGATRRDALDIAPHLATRCGILVAYRALDAESACGDGRGHAGRPGTDHQQRQQRAHAPSPGRASVRRTRMPSRTSTRQAWRLRSPSISTRHS